MQEDLQVDFKLFVSGLVAEGMVALGAIKNPVTQKTDTNFKHATYVIDTIDMLKKKTSGNLDDEESRILDDGIHHLRMLYVAVKDKAPEGGEQGADKS